MAAIDDLSDAVAGILARLAEEKLEHVQTRDALNQSSAELEKLRADVSVAANQLSAVVTG